MMFRRYHHGHSAGLGFLLALSLYGHALTYSLIVFAVGVVAGRAWGFWGSAARMLRDRLTPAKTPVVDEPLMAVYSSRRGNRPSDNDIPF